MKKLFLFIISCIIYHFAQAQTTDSLNYERLLRYYQSKQYVAAAEYLKGLSKDAADVKKLQQLGYANFMSGKYEDAEKDYLRANELLPGDPVTLTGLADLSAMLNQTEMANKRYLEVVKADSNNFNAYRQLAKLAPDTQHDLRKNYLIKANYLNPIDAEVAAELADTYFKETQFIKANELLSTALAADSTNLVTIGAKIPVSMALKKYNEALQYGKKLLKIYKSPPESLLFQMAMCYREIKDHKNAVEFFKQAINEGISPKTASYYGLLGESYESMKQNKEAIESYKRGLLFENNGSLYYNLALLYEDKLNDKKNAISYYTQYLSSIKNPEKQKRHIAFIKNKIEELKR